MQLLIKGKKTTHAGDSKSPDFIYFYRRVEISFLNVNLFGFNFNLKACIDTDRANQNCTTKILNCNHLFSVFN